MSTWTRPPVGFCKVNVVGYSAESMRFSTIGCVMRNITGYWIGGYYGKMDYETTLFSEIRAIYYGVKLGQDERIRNIQIESNSEEAIQHILNPITSFEGADLVFEIREMMNTFDSCVLQHVPESANQLPVDVAMYAIDEGVPKIEGTHKMGETRECILMRLQPKIFSDAIISLSEEQRNWVRTTGFESLLSFEMKQYPSFILKKLVSSYDPNTSSLKMNEKSLIITENCVHDVLGLPKGPNIIQLERNHEITYAWRSQFGDNSIDSFKVKGENIYDAIKSTDDVNLNFKLNFMVLLSNIFFKGSKNPYVIQDIIGFNGDLDNCKDYNWSEFLIRCLNTETSTWNENTDQVFYTGSIAFLVFIYMENFVDVTEPSSTTIPSFIKWKDLKIAAKLESDKA